MAIEQIIENTLYFLALINPVTKVLFLASKQSTCSRQELFSLSVKATIISILILLVLTSIGDFLLLNIFHVEIYSLSAAGGIILFIVGLTAVREGRFLNDNNKETQSLSDILVVPLAAPLIVGPGTMTAAITFASIHGVMVTNICIVLALLINLCIMLLSQPINYLLEKINATGPIIRITGLIVTSVAMQMVFSGCAAWISKIN